MPDTQLPFFPDGFTTINENIAFQRREGKVAYFNGHLPLFVHGEADLKSFRFFTTQLVVNGTASQAQIVRAFQVPPVTVKRYVKLFREKGAVAFFAPAKRRQGSRLTAEVLGQAQILLDQGYRVPEIHAQLGILPSTLHKAIDAGRLRPSDVAKKKSRGPRRRPRPRVSAG